jgi:catechol 2,3-dioxygenase-like lactoylglutathione lyase family enzyme
MSVTFNHTIVWATDRAASAHFLADVLGLGVSAPVGPFLQVRLDNDVTLDYAETPDPRPQHYAFLIDEEAFDAAFGRITAAGIPFYADPFHQEPGRLNAEGGGRGLYFVDPDGHNMELLTVA